LDWNTLIANKDREIARLDAVHDKSVRAAGGEPVRSHATLVDNHTIRLEAEGRTVTADQILIATGSRPAAHPVHPGQEHAITPNEAFDLTELPKAIVIEGDDYIAVEFANIFHGLGVETTLVCPRAEILSGFDMGLRQELHEAMERKGIRVLCQATSKKVERQPDGRLAIVVNDDKALVADQLILAAGRRANTEMLGLDAAGVKTGKTGEIIVDDYSRTNVENIWAIGDVTNRVQLTPVAIHEAMCFVETAFKGNPTAPDHGAIATAVFSQPEIGTVGLSEGDAGKQFADLEIYRALFRPMRHTLSGNQEKMLIKLVVDGASRKVLGAHILGPDAAEMAQVLAIPVKAGLTKGDFDRTMAAHPTAAEELVTMYKPSYRVKNGERAG
ncbi:MAG TPA: FAD-dependent oxidoreductase, partial [Mesorhizobium sp.]